MAAEKPWNGSAIPRWCRLFLWGNGYLNRKEKQGIFAVSSATIVGLSFIGVNASGFGFSVVVAGLFGYLAFLLLQYIRVYHAVRFKRSIFQLLWCILYVNLALISVIYGYDDGAMLIEVVDNFPSNEAIDNETKTMQISEMVSFVTEYVYHWTITVRPVS